jgi:Heterokaryon incompatibility protein (HET)
MGLYADLPLESTQNTIRLMRLQPGKDRSSPLIAELFVVSLDTNPQYAAISYCWGPPTVTRRLTCNNTMVDIRENLGLALANIRSISRLPTWVDQICVNQANIPERTAQVALMKRIYSQAIETFVYLGEPDSDVSEEACRVLETLRIPVASKIDMESKENSCKQIFQTRATAIKVAVQHPRLTKRLYNKDVTRAIDEWAHRSYFSRKWVIQEMALSRSLICLLGSHRFEWNLLYMAMTIECSKLPGVLGDGYVRVVWLSDLILGYHEGIPYSLLLLLYYSRFFKATDPRDNVFALLGAASDSNDFPKPDYGVAVEQLYHEVSRCFIQQGKGFLMLHLVGIRSTDNGLPSWVVDWRDLDTFYHSKYFASFRAGGTDGQMKLIDDAAIIRVSGTIVDRVVAIANPFDAEMNLWERLAQYIEDCTSAFEGFFEKGLGKLAIQKELASLISFEMKFNDKDPDREWFMFDEDYCDFMGCMDLDALDSTTSGQLALMDYRFLLNKFELWLSKTGQRIGIGGMSRFCQKLRLDETSKNLAEDAIANTIAKSNAEETFLHFNFFKPTTRPIMTRNRRLGLAPVLTQKDDVVCVIFGASAPFILRPAGDGTYKIVGEAYVQGIMFEETLKDDRYPTTEVLIR